MSKDLARISFAEVALRRDGQDELDGHGLWKALPLALVLLGAAAVFLPPALAPYASAIFCIAFAVIMRITGIHRAKERKQGLLAALRARYQATQARPGTSTATFETRVQGMSNTHRRLLLNESLWIPMAGIAIGLLHAAGVILGLDRDHVTMPMVAIVFLGFCALMAVQVVEHKRLRKQLKALSDQDDVLGA